MPGQAHAVAHAARPDLARTALSRNTVNRGIGVANIAGRALSNIQPTIRRKSDGAPAVVPVGRHAVMKNSWRIPLTQALLDILVFQDAVYFGHEQRGTAHCHAIRLDESRGQFEILLVRTAGVADRMDLSDPPRADEQRAVLSDRHASGVSNAGHVFLDLEAGGQTDFTQVEVRLGRAGAGEQHCHDGQCTGYFQFHIQVIQRERVGQKAISSTAANSTSRNGRLARYTRTIGCSNR